jgi:hypothetical protein
LLIDATNEIVLNGNSKSIAAVGISDPAVGHYEISVYPNPATDRLTVGLNFKENEKAKLTITDMLGKVCSVQELGTVMTGEQHIPVNISNLPSGTYFITLVATNGSVTSKFVK